MKAEKILNEEEYKNLALEEGWTIDDFIGRIVYLESQLKEEREKWRLKADNPYKFVLINPNGDTFTFNPQRGLGEELNDFLVGHVVLTQNPK